MSAQPQKATNPDAKAAPPTPPPPEGLRFQRQRHWWRRRFRLPRPLAGASFSRSQSWPNALIFAVAATLASLFFINFCAAVFRCGCVSLWNSADGHCNIHMAGASHCPWCMYGHVASAVPWAFIVAAQAAISFWPRPMRTGLRLVSAMAAFPVAGALLAAAYGLSSGYWK